MNTEQFKESKWFEVTITFYPYYSPGEKFKLIEKLPKLILGQMAWYSIEYHKKPNTSDNDVHRPHVHMLLRQKNTCNVVNIQTMKTNLERKYGRTTTTYLNTLTDVEKWYEYIQKDVSTNNELYPKYNHWRQFQTSNEIDLEEEEKAINDMDTINKKKNVRTI